MLKIDLHMILLKFITYVFTAMPVSMAGNTYAISLPPINPEGGYCNAYFIPVDADVNVTFTVDGNEYTSSLNVRFLINCSFF